MSERNGTINTPDGNRITINVLDNPHGAIINLYGKLGVIADFDESRISFQPSNRDHDGNYNLGSLVDKVNHPETVRFITAMRDYYVGRDIEQFRLHATVDWSNGQEGTLTISVYSRRLVTDLGKNVEEISREYAKHAWKLACAIYQHQTEN